MDAMVVSGAIACLGLSAAGSAFGTGFAASSAVGAWKKCYAANKPAPFILLGLVGAPITQTLYGMILMFIMLGKTSVAGAGVPLVILRLRGGSLCRPGYPSHQQNSNLRSGIAGLCVRQ